MAILHRISQPRDFFKSKENKKSRKINPTLLFYSRKILISVWKRGAQNQ